MISVYEFWKFKWSKRKSSYEQGNSAWELVSQFCISTALVIAWLAIRPVQSGWKSSIICPIVTSERQVLLWLEILAAMIDSVIVIMAEKLANMPTRQSSGPSLPFTTKWGLLLLVLWRKLYRDLTIIFANIYSREQQFHGQLERLGHISSQHQRRSRYFPQTYFLILVW